MQPAASDSPSLSRRPQGQHEMTSKAVPTLAVPKRGCIALCGDSTSSINVTCCFLENSTVHYQNPGYLSAANRILAELGGGAARL